MIEINLIAKKKASSLPTVAGIDLNLINFKTIILAIIVGFGANKYLEMTFESSIGKLQDEFDGLTKKIAEFDEKTKNNRVLKDQLDAYKKQIKKLEEKTKVVEEVLKRRNNPRSLLERIARNTPQDLWFTSLIIENTGVLTIKGRALSYKSIGDFSVLVGESRFFNGKKLELKSSETIEEKENDSTRRLESFTLSGKVESF